MGEELIQQVIGVDPAGYRPHAVHSEERVWTETNCYIDVWVEVLHSLGFDPLLGAAFTLSADFDGRQWSFIKYPPEDLRHVYGIEVAELNVWNPVIDHVEEELAAGRLLTVEVDAWFLPDTSGTSYRTSHTKTTIVPECLDRRGRRLGYFHNSGYHRLDGDDFVGVFRLEGFDDPNLLPPYVETIRLPVERLTDAEMGSAGRRRAAAHLARRPGTNPVARLAAGVETELARIAQRGLDYFHAYSFGTMRQCGATAELAAAHARWLDRTGGFPDSPAAEAFEEVASALKQAQFRLARAASGRTFDVVATFEPIAAAWERAIEGVAARHG